MASHKLRVDPQPSAIARLNDWVAARCRAEGLPGELGGKIMLAIEEAVTNVIRYAFHGLPPPHLIEVSLEIGNDTCIAQIRDSGRPFDPTAAPAPDFSLPLERRPPGGVGIHLMRSLVDRLDYRRDNGTNILRLEKSRQV
jgi:anti-sigma regulatory factor (Ser/Thr protein kinase)